MCDVNSFGPIALKAAYNESEDWLDELNLYIADNYKLLKEYMAEHLPKTEVIKLEGTYLVWVDISKLGLTTKEATRRLLKEGKVFVSSGTLYGEKAGEGYLRINLACTRAMLREGLQRMEKVLGGTEQMG